jgi:hypothetical protein
MPNVQVPAHPDEMTTDEAWDLALALLEAINQAEGRQGLDAYVTKRDVLDELVNVRTAAGRVLAAVQS